MQKKADARLKPCPTIPDGKSLKLVILTTLLRSDVHVYLKHFQRFEVWHLYNQRTEDIAPDQLGSRAIRFKNVFDLIIKILRLKPALIQGGEPYDFPTQLPLIVATVITSKLLRIPYYFPTFENMAPEKKFAGIKRLGLPLSFLIIPLVKWLARGYSRNAMVIFALNNDAKRNMLQLGVPERRVVRLMYGTWGVDTDRFTNVLDGTEPDMGQYGILFVGRLIESKGLNVLLPAFEKVKHRFPLAQLFIIGEGPLKQDLFRRATNLGIAASVHILGPILNYKLPPYFRAARVTVAPSISTRRSIEQVGMVNIQSMACGTPVVSTYSGSIPEYVIDGKTGILVPENDVPALAEAIIRLLTDERLRRQLAHNAREYALQYYDARRNIQKVEEVLLTTVRGFDEGCK
jgi:glycosyltransferase involved in cell wall biosynthesis